MTILTILIPAVVAAVLAIFAAVLHYTGGLWLVQRPATPSHDETQQGISATAHRAPDARGAVERRAIDGAHHPDGTGDPLPDVSAVPPGPTNTVTPDGLETTTMHGPGGIRHNAVDAVPDVTCPAVNIRPPRPAQAPDCPHQTTAPQPATTPPLSAPTRRDGSDQPGHRLSLAVKTPCLIQLLRRPRDRLRRWKERVQQLLARRRHPTRQHDLALRLIG